ncbi:MAG TPA: hypothetical protein VFQ16_11270 [Burkholderiaceae bacterium]|nr:hypothetical protein [Burkholderiaceae bacterium]
MRTSHWADRLRACKAALRLSGTVKGLAGRMVVAALGERAAQAQSAAPCRHAEAARYRLFSYGDAMQLAGA